MHYKIDGAYIKVTLHNAMNNISIDDISSNTAELLGYSAQKIIGINFIKILDYSVVSIIEDCIEFNDGTIDIVNILNKITNFYFKNSNNHAINCRIKSCNFASENKCDTTLYIRIMEVNLIHLWHSFFMQQNKFTETDKLIVMCKFIAKYNINSHIIIIECEKLNNLTNKLSIIQCIKNEFTQINSKLNIISHIAGDCFLAIICNTDDEFISKIIAKIYNRINCTLINYNVNSKIAIQQNSMLNYGRYTLSKISSIQDIIKLTMENIQI